MQEYTINVNEVEDLQMVNNTDELEKIFTRAKSTVIQGGSVILTRKFADGSVEKFDEMTTEHDLENYRETVFKYLW
jgi:hypothetical protein